MKTAGRRKKTDRPAISGRYFLDNYFEKASIPRRIFLPEERRLPRIEACLGSDWSHLVVAGAIHLARERGILRALGDGGHNIRQL